MKMRKAKVNAGNLYAKNLQGLNELGGFVYYRFYGKVERKVE